MRAVERYIEKYILMIKLLLGVSQALNLRITLI
jgi:hypothetical protein